MSMDEKTKCIHIMANGQFLNGVRPSTPLADPPREMSPEEIRAWRNISHTAGMHGDLRPPRGAGMTFRLRTPEDAREIQERAARMGNLARKQQKREAGA